MLCKMLGSLGDDSQQHAANTWESGSNGREIAGTAVPIFSLASDAFRRNPRERGRAISGDCPEFNESCSIDIT
jgi:hypothetical protein